MRVQPSAKEVWKSLTKEQRDAFIVMACGAISVMMGCIILLGWGGLMISIGLILICCGMVML